MCQGAGKLNTGTGMTFWFQAARFDKTMLSSTTLDMRNPKLCRGVRFTNDARRLLTDRNILRALDDLDRLEDRIL